MKAICFDKPLQYTLHVEGERWAQGDEISGKLEIENNSQAPVSIEASGVKFAFGDLKKIKNRTDGMFAEIEKVGLTEKQMKAGEKISISWKFTLDENSAITDKQGSYYLLYGNLEKAIPDSLQLTVYPREKIKLLIEMIERFYRFKLKEWKSAKKGGLECKLIPPASKDFSTMEDLFITFSHTATELKMHFLANVKRLGADAVGMKISKEKKEFDVTWEHSKYLLSGKFLNQDYILKEFPMILEKLKMKVV
jgi:hypothetical protein